MLKYLAILSLGLCACGGAVNTPAPEVAHQSVLPPVVHFEASETMVEVHQSESQLPITVELSRGQHAQAVRCSNDLECYQKLDGVCSNGYVGGQSLTDGQHVVGMIFRCITNEEKAAAAQRAAEEKAQMEAYQAAAKAASEEAQLKAQEAAKKQQKSPKAPAKK